MQTIINTESKYNKNNFKFLTELVFNAISVNDLYIDLMDLDYIYPADIINIKSNIDNFINLLLSEIDDETGYAWGGFYINSNCARLIGALDCDFTRIGDSFKYCLEFKIKLKNK